jgi:hypothetical protein
VNRLILIDTPAEFDEEFSAIIHHQAKPVKREF